MGDAADMILDGIIDEQTGEFIDDEDSWSGGTGYPRTMNKDFSFHTKQRKRIYFSNLPEHISTVFNFLHQRGISHQPLQSNVIKQYAIETGLYQRKVGKICLEIRKSKEDWIKFKTWLNNK